MEKYLARCLESLLKQTFNDYEVLIIDDGSTDQSAEICQKYVKQDMRMKYIYKRNGGLSDARNTGVRIAKGDFITFLDSDDYVHPLYLEYLFGLCKKYDADIASCVHLETSEENCFFESSREINSRIECMTGKDACMRMVTDLAPVLTAACGKLYKTDIVKQYEFPYGRLHEDVATTYKYYMKADKVVYGASNLYAYYQHSESIMHKVNLKKVEDELWALSERAIGFEKSGEQLLSDASWQFMFKFLERDIMQCKGNKKIWKKYGKLCSSHVSHEKTKIKIWILLNFPIVWRIVRVG